MKRTNKAWPITIVTVLVIGSAGAMIAYKQFNAPKSLAVATEASNANKLSDDDMAELKNVSDKISKASNLYIEGQYKLVESSTGKLLEQEPFILAKHKDATYLMTGYLEQLSSNNRTAIVNNETRTIVAQATDNRYSDKKQAGTIDALLNLKEYLDVFDSSRVYHQRMGDDKVIRIVTNDQQALYKETQVTYGALNYQLKNSSVHTTVIDNGNNGNIEKQVELKLEIITYSESATDERPRLLSSKISWKKNKLIMADSLKNYSINYPNK